MSAPVASKSTTAVTPRGSGASAVRLLNHKEQHIENTRNVKTAEVETPGKKIKNGEQQKLSTSVPNTTQHKSKLPSHPSK